jgi:clan AA aspartic protease
MGTFTVQIQVGDPQSQQFVEVEALVDTGAGDTVVPRAFLERLGVPVQDRWPFTMADDRVVEYDIGQTAIQINGRNRIVPVVFGETGTTILGASAMEIFHLAADPVHKRLTPVTGLLM